MCWEKHLSLSNSIWTSSFFRWICSYSFSEEARADFSHFNSFSASANSHFAVSRLTARCLSSWVYFKASARQTFICKVHSGWKWKRMTSGKVVWRVQRNLTCSSLWAILIFKDSSALLTCWSCLAKACFSESRKLCICFVFTLSETSCSMTPTTQPWQN